MDIDLQLSSIDIFIFILITFLTYIFVLWGNLRKKNNNTDSFIDTLLMGRRLTLPMFTVTLVATWYGGIFGVAKIAFESGLYNFFTQGFFWYLTYIIFAFFIADKIRTTDAITLPDLVGINFGQSAKKIAAVFNILNLLPIAYIISIGLFINILFPLGQNLAMFLGLLFVLGYSLFGGFRSVVYSDLFQFIIMTSAVFIVCFLSIWEFGLDELTKLPDSYFSFTGNSSLLETFSWGLIALGTLVDPNFYQRCFAAKSPKTARAGILLATLIWVIFDLSLTFGAMYARAHMPELNSQGGYIIYSTEILPVGLKGFFLAGICATILSTLDSYLFLAGTTLSYDLFQSNHKILHQRIGMIIIAILSYLLALFFDGDIKKVWKTIGGLSTSALLIPMLWSYISHKKMNHRTFIISMCVGALSCVLWNICQANIPLKLDGIYVGIICSFMSIVLHKKITS